MAHANVVETAGISINVDQWLQNAKLSELKPKFADDSITIEELMELSPEDLLEFANDELQLKSLKRNRFIKAIRKSIASSSIAMQPGAITTAVTGETMGSGHDDADIDDADLDDDDDEKKAEMKEQEEAILKGQQILKSVLNRIDLNLQKINVFLDEGIQSESKKRLDAIHQVFELFATKLMERKSKLIDEFNAATEKQVVAIKAFQSEMNAFKHSVETMQSLKDKPTIIAKQKELIESSTYSKIKSFVLPIVKLAIDKESVLTQIRDFGNIETRSMLTANAGNNQMLNSSMPSSTKNMITIQIGGCGNKMGNLFWETLKNEYMMDDELRTDSVFPEDVDTYFREIADNRYIPRGIAYDTNYSKVSPLLNKSNILQFRGQSTQRSVFAAALYGIGKTHYDEHIEDCIRKEVEVCDLFRGFQLHCNVGGGVGSGSSALLCSKLKDEYYQKAHLYFTCFPGKQYCVPFEPYNVAMALFHQIDWIRFGAGTDSKEGIERAASMYNQNRILPTFERDGYVHTANALIPFDNEIAHKLCTTLKGKAQNKMDFDAINRIHNLMITDITSTLRLPTSTEVVSKSEIVSERAVMDWCTSKEKKKEKEKEKQRWKDSDDEDSDNEDAKEKESEEYANRGHRFVNFWTPSYCPLFLTSYQQEIDNRLSVKALTTRIMNQKNESTNIVDRYQLIYRGNLDSELIKQALDGRFEKGNQFKVYNVRTPSSFTKTSAVKLDNGNGWILDRVKGMLADAEALYKKRDFVLPFTREGMEEMEFLEAFDNVRWFIKDHHWQDYDDEQEEDEDGDNDEDDDNEEEEEDW